MYIVCNLPLLILKARDSQFHATICSCSILWALKPSLLEQEGHSS